MKATLIRCLRVLGLACGVLLLLAGDSQNAHLVITNSQTPRK